MKTVEEKFINHWRMLNLSQAALPNFSPNENDLAVHKDHLWNESLCVLEEIHKTLWNSHYKVI